MEREARDRLVERLNRDAARIAAQFGLTYASIEAERPAVRRRYGVCYSDGRIRIRLRHATTGNALKYSSLVNTLCHELAHLRHFNHGERFKAFYLRILEWSRGAGIYEPRDRDGVRGAGNVPGAAVSAHGGAIERPSPRRKPRLAAPEQLRLFV